MTLKTSLRDGSQAQRILDYLRRGKTLTRLSALRYFDCLHLGGRIHQLRRRGVKIKREMIILSSGKTVARYFIRPARPRSLA